MTRAGILQSKRPLEELLRRDRHGGLPAFQTTRRDERAILG
jgi:hypothetical protein